MADRRETTHVVVALNTTPEIPATKDRRKCGARAAAEKGTSTSDYSCDFRVVVHAGMCLAATVQNSACPLCVVTPRKKRWRCRYPRRMGGGNAPRGLKKRSQLVSISLGYGADTASQYCARESQEHERASVLSAGCKDRWGAVLCCAVLCCRPCKA